MHQREAEHLAQEERKSPQPQRGAALNQMQQGQPNGQRMQDPERVERVVDQVLINVGGRAPEIEEEEKEVPQQP